MREILSLFWRMVLDSLFPAFCLGCKIEGVFLCEDCLGAVPRLKSDVDSRADRLAGASVGAHFLDGVIAGSKFEEGGLLQRAIHGFKYDFLEELASPLGQFLFEAFEEFLCDFLQKYPDRKLVLCPLPLHQRRLSWRGFNQAELLCLAVMQRLRSAGFENVEMALVLQRVHFSRPQMELDREQRLENMKSAFKVVGEVDPMSVIVLVDDIATTLSTLENAALVLKAAGVREVYGLVLARVF